ncbi:MAG: tetratricopeptide repeat protein [Planctomycetes bacterium]|nr:tetratricopeptide repeat protein [Planctomycetota bacterium]
MFAEQAYLFRHALVREAAYELQTPGHRAELHRVAAFAVIDLYDGHPDDDLADDICRHLQFARADKDSAELEATEFHYLKKAAHYAAAEWRHTDAVRLYMRLCTMGDIESRARSAIAASSEQQFLGNIEAAQQILKQALDEHSGFPKVRIERAYGRVLYLRNQLEQAETVAKRCVEYCRKHNEAELLSICLNDLGSVLQARSQGDQAMAAYMEASTVDGSSAGSALANIGTLHYEKGDYENALDYYEQALALHRTRGDKQAEAITLGNIGAILRLKGSTDTAERHYLDGIRLCREIGDVPLLASFYSKLANLCNQLGRLDQAAELFRSAIEIERESSAGPAFAQTLCNFGLALSDRGEPQEAESAFREAVAVLEANPNRRFESFARGCLGQHLLETNRLAEAELHLRRAVELGDEIGDVIGKALNMATLGGCRRGAGELQEAESLERQSIALLEAAKDMHGVGTGRCGLAMTLYAQGRRDEADTEWEAGSSEIRRANDPMTLKNLQKQWNRIRNAGD